MRKYDDRDIDANPDQEDVPSQEELEAEDREWDRQIAAKPDVLSRLVTQAKKRLRDGETEELDPDDL